MTCNCDHEEGNSSFVFGILIGIIVGALIAIVIYKKNKGKIFDIIEDKVKDLFDTPTTPTTPPKKPVTLPPQIIAATTPAPASKSKAKTFKKAK